MVCGSSRRAQRRAQGVGSCTEGSQPHQGRAQLSRPVGSSSGSCQSRVLLTRSLLCLSHPFSGLAVTPRSSAGRGQPGPRHMEQLVPRLDAHRAGSLRESHHG